MHCHRLAIHTLNQQVTSIPWLKLEYGCDPVTPLQFMHPYLVQVKYVQLIYIVISSAQTDLGLRSRTFSLKINKFPTFTEITQAWQIVFLWSDKFTY